jgi:formylglycine-generating enzyme required for sulfatase activity
MREEIFLSYARKDRKRAKIFAEAIEKKGYSVWWDWKMLGGGRIDKVIQDKLDTAKCVIVLWSNDSVKSDWVIDEADTGKRTGILIPVLVDNVNIPLGFRRIHTLNLVGWEGDSTHKEFELLLQSIAEIAGAPVIKEIIKPITPQEELEKITKIPPAGDIIINSIGMKFKLIPAGEFMMGSNEYDSEKPVHKVTIGDPFYLGIYPVTQQEWKAVMSDNPSRFDGERLPVETVSWIGVQEFIKKINEKEGTNKYRLPTEAQWEYAVRGGTATRYSFGDDESKLGDYAWFNSNSEGKTHEVGQKKPNPWGLYDMLGNVWEWVQDSWHDNYNGAPIDGSFWEGGSNRVFRGGSWDDYAGNCRSAYRSGHFGGYCLYYVTFRLLRVL